jgi:hypothetical protein
VVISPITGGLIYIILGDGEFLPERFNIEKTVVFRRDKSTNNELHLLKPAGEIGPATLTQPTEAKPVCNYSGDGNPLHQHEDGGWWHYDADWTLEHGPFKTFDEGYAALEAYCEGIESAKNFLTVVDEFINMYGVGGIAGETSESANDDSTESPDSD